MQQEFYLGVLFCFATKFKFLVDSDLFRIVQSWNLHRAQVRSFLEDLQLLPYATYAE